MASGKWWTFFEKFGGALLALGAILAAIGTGSRFAAIVVGGAGFLVLVMGLVGQVRSTRQTADREAVPVTFSTSRRTRGPWPGTAGVGPRRPRSRKRPSRRGPEETCPSSSTVRLAGSRGPGGHQPDITLRVAVALPGVLPHIGGREPRRVGVTRLDGEARERVIEQALNLSPLTTWLIAQREVWHWDEGELLWGAYGSGYPEYTEYRFLPLWSSLAGDRVPFQARAAVETGWHTTGQDGVGSDPAIQIACDLTLNILELDSERRRAPIPNTTTPSPVPAALKPTEVVELPRQPVADHRRCRNLGPALLPRGDYGHGQVAAWIQVSQRSARTRGRSQFAQTAAGEQRRTRRIDCRVVAHDYREGWR